MQPGGVRSSWGGSGPVDGGVSILRPLAGDMSPAFTQEDFLVCIIFKCITSTLTGQ